MLALVLGLVGLGGIGAAAAFIPAFLPAVISIGATILRCKPCLIALAIIAAFIFGDVRRHRIETAKCAAADVAMQLKAKQRDADILAAKVQFQDQQLVALEGQSDDLKKRLAEYEGAPKVACPLGVDRAGRLRNILTR